MSKELIQVTRSRHRVLVGLFLLTAGFCGVAYSGWLNSLQLIHTWNLAWLLFSSAAAVRSFQTAIRLKPGYSRRAWTFFGLAAASWAIGMVYLIWLQFARPEVHAFPTVANYFFMGYAPLFAAGLFYLRAGQPSIDLNLRRLANLGLIVTVTLIGSTIILFEPLSRSGRSFEVIFFSIADPAAFTAAALFSLTSLWLLDLKGLRPVCLLMFAAIATHAVADLLYFHETLSPSGPSYSVEFSWLIAFSFQCWAAFEQEHAAFSEGKPGPPKKDAAFSSQFEAFLPSALIAATMLIAALFRDNISARLIGVLIPLILVFVLFLGFREWWSHRHEAALLKRVRESTDRAMHVLSASPAVVFLCQPFDKRELTFISSNVVALLGLSDPMGRPWDHVHPDDRRLVEQQFDLVLKQESVNCEFRLECAGTYRWIDQKMILHRNQIGQPVEIIGSMVDVSEAKRLEHQVRQGQRLEALGRLAGGIAHDFNNLLTTILGYADLSLQEPTLPPEIRPNLEAVRSAGGKAADLTQQLLAFSRKQAMRLKVIDVNTSVLGMTGMLNRVIGEDIHMFVKPSIPAVRVKADAGRLEQVIANLLINARDAMPGGGEVHLEIDHVLIDQDSSARLELQPGSYARISVTDDGVGMSEEVKARVFEPFFTTKPTGEGTGLGLATIHGIVQQHQGHVLVSSSPGQGTRFEIYLPATTEPVDDTQKLPRNEIKGGNETILVVDDEVTIPSLIRDALTPVGYRVLSADNSALALQICAFEPTIHLLLTDVVLPDLNGAELASRVRSLHRDVLVVYMSGYPDDERVRNEVTSGRAPLLEKPLALGQLAETIRNVLDRGDGNGNSNSEDSVPLT